MGFELETLLERLLELQACEEVRIAACLYPGADKRDILTYEMEETMDPDETGYVWDLPGVD